MATTPKTARTARLVLVMAGSEKEAASIARTLVDERLAACVNIIGPGRSIYRWRGAVEDAREYLLLIKTSARLYTKVERRVRELHSYEVPEVVALPFASGSHPYLEWLFESTAAK
jgi:periplasmic divalent cation tolerance protein